MRQALLVLLVIVVLVFLRKKATPRDSGRAPEGNVPERMVECAHCGVNLPISESVRARGRHYCCEDHWKHDV
jgi:uncharacterized protein